MILVRSWLLVFFFFFALVNPCHIRYWTVQKRRGAGDVWRVYHTCGTAKKHPGGGREEEAPGTRCVLTPTLFTVSMVSTSGRH
ncbi:hypothetical protein F5148DRAFT_1256689, partial [Russula earlei]